MGVAKKKAATKAVVRNLFSDDEMKKTAAEIKKTMAAQKARKSKVKKPGLGSWQNPRVRESDGKAVYSTTIHIPREVSKCLDRVRLEDKLRLNAIINEAIVDWLRARGVRVPKADAPKAAG